MRRLSFITGSVTVLLIAPLVTLAQFGSGLVNTPDAGPLQVFLRNLLTFTQSVLIPFILGIGFLVFVWGMLKFFIVGGANDDAKEEGRSLMIYATLGFVLVIVFWGVVNLLANSTGLQGKGPSVNAVKVLTI